MAITISGENNNDRITAQDGVIDTISGFNIAGIITASSFTGDLTGNVTGNLSGNVTGNINNTTLLLQTGGNERIRIDSGGRVGLGIANPGDYFSSYNRVVMGRTNDTGGMTIVSSTTSGGYISFADGTSGNQAYRGMIAYQHGQDAMTFNTAATERVRIDSSGNFGIGTNNPEEILHIHEDGTGPCDVRISNSEGYGFLRSDSNLLAYNAQLHLFANRDRSVEYLRITNQGQIGIGTISPTASIHLHKASGDVYQKIESSNGAASLELRHTNGYGYIRYLQDGSETFRAGQIAQFTSYSIYNPSSSLPYQLCVEGNGEVGINTHNPGDTLHLLRNNANHGIRLQRGGTNPGSAYVQVHSNGVLSLQGGNNIHYVSGGSQQHIWYRAGTEIGRFDTSGSFNASNIVQVGTTNDSGELRIGHDGSSYRARLVSNSANRLTIDADGPERIQMHGGVIYMRPLNTEKSAAFVANGAVELYHNDIKKFETTSAGADFSLASGGQVNLYHLGSDGGLRISGPQSASSATLFFNTNHQNVSGGTDYYTITCGGANHTLMFKRGDMSGTTVLELDDTQHVRIPQDNKALKIGASQDFQFSHDGSTNIINGLYHPIEIRHQSEVHIKCVDDGAVELYHNNTKRFETVDNSPFVGVSVIHDVILNSTGDSAYRWAVNGNASSNFKWSMYYANSDGALRIFDNVNSRVASVWKNDGTIELNHSGTKVVETTGSGLKFNQTSGNLIKYGTTSEFPHAAINIYRGGNGYANIRLSSNYGCGLYLAGANNNTDEFSINQDNQKNGYVDNRGGFISFNTGSSGTQRMKIENSAQITFMGNLFPSSDNSYDIGSGAKRWRNIYTADLHCSNKGSSNDVDGTWGDYTIQEGESDLFLINNRSGKKYKFNLTEVS